MVNDITQIMFGLAVVLVATAGLAMTLGAERIRDALVRFATAAVVVALGLPVVSSVLGRLRCGGGRTAAEVDVDPRLVVAVVVGHVALAVFLLRRRAGAQSSGFVVDVEAARGRERVRLTPPIDREDVR